MKFLFIIFICLVGLEIYAQETKRPETIYYKDLNIFKLEGIEEITKTKKADRYVILNRFDDDSLTFTIVDKRNKSNSMIMTQKGPWVFAENLFTSLYAKADPATSERFTSVGKDSILVLQQISWVEDRLFPILLISMDNKIQVERWRSMQVSDTISLKQLLENSLKVMHHEFSKVDDKWNYARLSVSTNSKTERILATKHVRFIDILLWCEKRRCQIY